MVVKKKKLKLKKEAKFILIAIACLLCASVINGFNKPKESKEVIEITPTPTPAEVISTSEEPIETETPVETSTPEPAVEEDKVVSLFMLGDALIQIENTEMAHQEDGSDDWSPQLDAITNMASKYDLAYYNQEVPLGGYELEITVFPHLNTSKTFGTYMMDKGFNLISLANNHCLDKDEQGVINTKEVFNANPQVVTAGTNLSQEERDSLNLFEVNGIRFAFNSWTYDMNFYYPPEGKEYMVNQFRGHEEEMLNWVRRAKEQADFVIVAMHWGYEFSHYINEEQEALSQALADAGTDLIIGNHAHSIQPIRWIDNCLCYYALGNIISSQTVPDWITYHQLNTGMISTLNFIKDKDGNKRIEDIKVDLLYTYNYNDYSEIYSVKYDDIPEGVFPDSESYKQNLIDNVVHYYDDSFKIGLE